MTYKDYPFYEVAKQAEELVQKGGTVYQKFTCENCGSRQTMDEEYKFFTTGKCEECGFICDNIA